MLVSILQSRAVATDFFGCNREGFSLLRLGHIVFIICLIPVLGLHDRAFSF